MQNFIIGLLRIKSLMYLLPLCSIVAWFYDHVRAGLVDNGIQPRNTNIISQSH